MDLSHVSCLEILVYFDLRKVGRRPNLDLMHAWSIDGLRFQQPYDTEIGSRMQKDLVWTLR